MNQSKFSLADLLTVLGTLGFGFFCYLSVNFHTSGDTITSVIMAAIFSLLLGGLAFTLKLKKSTSRNFKSSIAIEGVMLFIFLLIALIAVFPFSHFFYISAQKENIQQKIITNIDNAEVLYTEYESYAKTRMEIYEAQLKSAIYTKQTNIQDYTKFGFSFGANDDIQKKNKLFSLKAKLFPSNYDEMKQVNTNWLTNSKQKILNWSPLSIVKIVNILKDEIPAWVEQLNSYSSFKAKGEDYHEFEFKLSDTDFSTDLTQKYNTTSFSIFLAIALYVIMLLPYLIEKRHSKFPGLKMIFRNNIKKGNEL